MTLRTSSVPVVVLIDPARMHQQTKLRSTRRQPSRAMNSRHCPHLWQGNEGSNPWQSRDTCRGCKLFWFFHCHVERREELIILRDGNNPSIRGQASLDARAECGGQDRGEYRESAGHSSRRTSAQLSRRIAWSRFRAKQDAGASLAGDQTRTS